MKCLLCLVFVFSLAIGRVAAQPAGYTLVEDASALEQEFRGSAATVRSISSSFVQEKQLAYLDEVIESKGAFWYRNDNSLRWAYDSPFHYLIVIKEGRFFIKDQEEVKVFDVQSNPAFKLLNDLIISIAKGSVMGDERFALKVYEGARDYLLVMQPLDAQLKQFIQQSEVYLDKESLLALRVIIRESDTDFTQISFVNRKLNEPIEDAVFDVR